MVTKPLVTALRVSVVLACGVASWWSYRLIRADRLFREDTPQSIRNAMRLAPGDARFYIRLAQLNEANAVPLLRTALRLSPFNAAAAIELGLRAESDGDYIEAERLLNHAFDVDRTYVPRWTLVGFHFRRGNLPEFWRWARRAAEMPAGDIGALFQLCWRVDPSPERIARTVLTDDLSSFRQYIGFLLARDEIQAAAVAGAQLVQRGKASMDRPLLLSIVNGLVARNDSRGAVALWRTLADHHWIAVDRSSLVNNARFLDEPLPSVFDWHLPSTEGLRSLTGPDGLEVEFSGKQAEACLLAEQTVPLAPGRYRFRFQSRTDGIPDGSGLSWTISQVQPATIISTTPIASSDPLTERELFFSINQQNSLIRLQCDYRRTIGTTRISGVLALKSAMIERLPPA